VEQSPYSIYEYILHWPTTFGEEPYFLSLIREKQRLKEEIKRIEQMIEKIERKLLSINTDNLELSPFHIELRFKSVDYNLIQKLKEWEGCNQEKTDKSPASIRIVLK